MKYDVVMTARVRAPLEREAHRFAGLDAGGVYPCLQHVVTHAARPQRIGHHPADHAALHGSLHRGNHALGHGVVRDDVEKQMEVRARRVDVGDEPVDDRAVVAHDFHGVAAEDRQPAQLFREPHRGRDTQVLLGMEDVRMRGEARVDGLGEFPERSGALQAPFRHPAPAEYEVERKPYRRLEQDQQQPAFRGIGRAAERDHDQHDDADSPLGDHERRKPDLGVRQERHRRRCAWRCRTLVTDAAT
jgi:hypothetical protein